MNLTLIKKCSPDECFCIVIINEVAFRVIKLKERMLELFLITKIIYFCDPVFNFNIYFRTSINL